MERYLTLEHVKAWMPLAVVLATALLTGYLLPQLSSRVQDQRKELEIKTSLVEAINTEVMEILLAVQLYVRQALPQDDFDQSYRRWEVQRAILEGRLHAYFPKTPVPDAFDGLSEGVTDLYALTGIHNPKYRDPHIDKMRRYFGEDATDWAKLGNWEIRSNDLFDWFGAWWGVREACKARKDEVIRSVLATRLNLGA